VDYIAHFSREAAAFEAAARVAAHADAAPAVPSCPGWVATDLILHLGMVHRFVVRVISERLQEPPSWGNDWAWLELPGESASWLPPGHAPHDAPVPSGLAGWFGAGAARLREQFLAAGPDDRVWTWSPDHRVGFWQRMQAIEAAVHRWDADNAVGPVQPIDPALAADAVGQTFEVMAPMRRAYAQAPPGQGERFLFRRTDGEGTWAVRFDGADVEVSQAGSGDIEISGTASDLMLFLWQRIGAERLGVRGEESLLDRYFVLVPPL
jgi:uncharacterized protein (TIGR03083 family)